MSRTPRHTEEIAQETLYGPDGLIHRFTKLTIAQPTTAELEEAQVLLPLVQSAMRAWVSSRHLIETANRRRIPVNSPAMDEAMDRVERVS